MTFETALTGLNAASADLDVTGNNIANGATVGFKYSRAEFADIFASSSSQNAVGQGVRLANVSQQFTQGQFSFTGNNLDLAINGNGFFRMSSDGQVSYSRAGSFALDREGYIVDAGNRRLTGFTADASGNITGAIGELQVQTGDVAPRATGTTGIPMDITANLDAGADPTTWAVDATTGQPDVDAYNFSTSTTVYDSLGRSHLMTFYFTKGAGSNWDVYTELQGHPDRSIGPISIPFDNQGAIDTATGIAAPASGFNPADFDADGLSSNVAVTGATTAQFDFNNALAPLAGANNLSFEIDFANLTQYGTPFAVTRINQDGYAAGQFASMTVEDDGTIFARYTNGQSTALGRVTLSQFPSPQNLQQIGDTQWVETFSSGAPLNGQPGGGGLGMIQSGSLEQSNVNTTEQLIKMITAQRNYQANAKMISAQDEITQEILNIR